MVSEKLTKIQTKVKAPKNLYNSFGKYNYRNAEGICEAVKPYLEEQGCSLTLADDVVEVGGRVYIKATATLTDNKDGDSIQVSAMARESEDKKGMDLSQITGTASSYARKYALNGLFLLDDTKDADTDEAVLQERGKEKISEKEVKILENMCKDKAFADYLLKGYEIKDFHEMRVEQYSNLMQTFKQREATFKKKNTAAPQ